MQIDPNTLIGGSAAIITSLGGLWTGYRHLKYSMQAKKDRERQAILEEAKSQVDKVKRDLEEKIKKVELELENQKENVLKDMNHLKETYNAEVKVLGQRIEELRQDLSQQHQGLVNLLTKLIDKP